MTKREIVKTISDKTGFTQLQIKAIVELAFEGIVETLQTEGRVELRNFGVFQVKTRKPRMARNPKTGRQVNVPEKLVISFKAGKEMEQRIQGIDRTAILEVESLDDESDSQIDDSDPEESISTH